MGIVGPNKHGGFLRQIVFNRSFVFDVLNIIFLGFIRNRADVFLGSPSLERRLASLEVGSVVLGTYEREDDDVCDNTSDEDALDNGIIWHVFWAI